MRLESLDLQDSGDSDGKIVNCEGEDSLGLFLKSRPGNYPWYNNSVKEENNNRNSPAAGDPPSQKTHHTLKTPIPIKAEAIGPIPGVSGWGPNSTIPHQPHQLYSNSGNYAASGQVRNTDKLLVPPGTPCLLPPDVMALVAPPNPGGWREHGMGGNGIGPTGLPPLPPSSPTELHHHHDPHINPGPNGLLNTPTTQPPQPTSSASSAASPNSASIKTENIECVVCGDKSSGKHYGQFTCEGKTSFLVPFNYKLA